MSGVRELRYASSDPIAGSVNMFGSTPYLGRKPIRIVGPQRADLEIVIMAMYVEFILHGKFKRTKDILDSWSSVIPQGVKISEALFKSGQLRQMRDAGRDVSEVLNRISEGL